MVLENVDNYVVPLHFQAEVHARIQGSCCNYSKSDRNFRHLWLRNMTNDDGISVMYDGEGVNNLLLPGVLARWCQKTKLL